MARKNFEGLRLHDRTQMVQLAGNEFTASFITLCEHHRLTTAERIQLLTSEIQSIIKYAIREERHGDSDKRGDEA